MKLGDGLFLRTCTEVAKEYEAAGIKFDQMIVDNTSVPSHPPHLSVDVYAAPGRAQH